MAALYGASGEVSLVVEIAKGENTLVLPSSATWTDVTADVRAWRTRRGRVHELRRFEAGTATLLMNNRAGDWNPQNTAGAHSPDLVPGLPIRLVATFSGTPYPIWYGFVESFPLVFPGQADATVEIECSDMFDLLANADHTAALSAELSSVRINGLLTAYGVPAGLLDLDTGVIDMAARTTVNSTVLSEANLAADTELGQLFVAADGKATLHYRYERDTNKLTPVDIFGPANIIYQDVVASTDRSELFNQVVITAAAGNGAANDSTSQTSYGIRSLQLTHDPSDPNLAQSAAEGLVDRYKDPRQRVRSLDVVPAAQPNDWNVILAAEISDRFTVRKTLAGDDIDQDVHIEAVEHVSPEAGVWITSYMMSPAGTQGPFWILGDATAGVLGTTTRLGY